MHQPLLMATLGNRYSDGHTCSTAAAEALQRGNAAIFKNKNPHGVSPSDFLRRVGSDFHVTGVSLPEQLTSKSQLRLNHLLKAGPMVTRGLLAAPLLYGAYSAGRKALDEH